MQMANWKISAINVHAPAEESSHSGKNDLFDQMKVALDACPIYDIEIVSWDLNVKVGREPIFSPMAYKGTLTMME